MIEIKEIITDNKDLEYIKECAESVGMDVTDRTAFTIPFIAEVMRRINKFNRSKEVYNKGYDDGREAIAFHYELCKEEGSIIVVPDGATNGQMIRTMFPDAKIVRGYKEYILVTFSGNISMSFNMDWWDEPYRKEQE